MARLLDGFVERADDVLFREGELAVLVRPPLQVLAECAARDGHAISINKVVLEQIRENL